MEFIVVIIVIILLVVVVIIVFSRRRAKGLLVGRLRRSVRNLVVVFFLGCVRRKVIQRRRHVQYIISTRSEP
jgi:hypothetical protein